VLKRGGVAAELRNPPTVPETEEELGELLLGIVQSARAQGLDPERALRTRVRAIEAGWTPPA
jgi:XTP/dITP diphosphohydrolase